MKLELTPVNGIPLIRAGDDLVDLINQAVVNDGIVPENGDILVLAQKIVSKAENRMVSLADVRPSQQAFTLAEATGKDARFVELVLRESNEVLRYRFGTLIVEHHCGFVCANAGIDHSNVMGESGMPEDWVLLLPENPDASAEKIQTGLQQKWGKSIGVMIIDSHGRAWRNGTVGVAIGIANVPGLVDLRGYPDIFGYKLRVTQVAAADELGAAASLVMGQADEQTPVVHVRGFPYPLRESHFNELIRPRELDMFR